MDEDKNEIAAAIPPPTNLIPTDVDVGLSQLEQLGELDPEVTRRLARALDRLQLTRPYQPVSESRPSVSSSESQPQPQLNFLTEEEKALHEEFVRAELASLLAIAGQLNRAYELQAEADPHYRKQLKAEILRQARQIQ